MPLRRRLTLTMAVLLVIGVVVADIVTYTSLRSSLYGRLDAQLASSQRAGVRYLDFTAAHGQKVNYERVDTRINGDVFVILVGPNGRPILSRPSTSGSSNRPDAAPVLPPTFRREAQPGHNSTGAYHPDPNAFTLNGPGVTYRALAVAVPQGTLITAVSLTSTNDTLSSLLSVELLTSLAVVAATVLLALWTIRRGLRPLDEMAEASDAIASGDLTRRVTVSDQTTEVGRLGTAFNSMLGQIEAAFQEKSGSEARLRQFVADASHELRTPLTSIRGYTELLQKGAIREEAGRQRALDRIEREAVRMGRLVDDLLLLARLDQGRPLAGEPVELRRLAREALDDARALDPERPMSIHAPARVVVHGDRDRLAQVAHNLVRNALTHTAPGTEVRVEVTSTLTRGVLSVADEGPGLSPEEAERVFDRFYRRDVARTSGVGGSGLGLAIVQAIAEALGGRATVETSPGHGARFSVEIPLESQPGSPPGPVVGPEEGALRPGPPSPVPVPRGPVRA